MKKPKKAKRKIAKKPLKKVSLAEVKDLRREAQGIRGFLKTEDGGND